MKTTSIRNGLIVVVCLAAGMFGADAPAGVMTPAKRIELFNGKDLRGWYTWLRDYGLEDPHGVFAVQNGMIRISGVDWGGIATRASYRDYHLVVEWKWGGPAHGRRAKAARDSGILLHGRGRDGAHGGTWLESIECQIIEGGSGDIILVSGEGKPSLTVETRAGEGGEVYWQKGGTPLTRDSGRFNWYGRDPNWKDVLGYRGPQDVERPVGQWNRSEAICEGDNVTLLVNGVVVNAGTRSSHTWGKIQIQSEGAEIWIRKVELRPVKRGS